MHNQESDQVLNQARLQGFDEESCELLELIILKIRSEHNEIPPNLRYIDRGKIKSVINKINPLLTFIETRNITETNKLIFAVANVTADLLNHKRNDNTNNKKEESRWFQMQMKVRYFGAIFGIDLLNYNDRAECIRELETDLKDTPRQENLQIEIDQVRGRLKKMPNWKGPGPGWSTRLLD